MDYNNHINSKPNELYPDAKVVDMTLTAKHGEITLVDLTNNKHIREHTKSLRKHQKKFSMRLPLTA